MNLFQILIGDFKLSRKAISNIKWYAGMTGIAILVLSLGWLIFESIRQDTARNEALTSECREIHGETSKLVQNNKEGKYYCINSEGKDVFLKAY